jgi:hypothetical protein
MKPHPKAFQIRILTLAVAMALSACGGGDASPPAETIAPTLNLASSSSGIAVGPVTFTFTFSEDVGNSFTAEDVVVTGGAKGSFTRISPLQYSLVVTPASNTTGVINVSIAAGAVQDLVGNPSTSASSLSQAFNTKPPELTITSSAAGQVATGPVTYTFQFSKDVGSSFTESDITVTGATKGAFTRASGQQATLVVTPLANSKGVIALSVAAGAFADAGGNANPSAVTAAPQAYDSGTPVVATRLVSFEEATPPALAGFGGAEESSIVVDPTLPSNKVAKVIKSASAELWAGTTVSTCPGNTLVKLPFSATATQMSARVWSPDAGIPVRLKVENAANGEVSVESQTNVTTASGWQTLTFDFAAPVAGSLNTSATYNRASIFFNFGRTGAQAGGAKTYYFDDLSFVGTNFSTACPASASNWPTLNFDDASTTYTFTGFGGAEDTSKQPDPTGGSNMVARVIKSGGAETWAGTIVSTGPDLSVPKIPFSDSAKTMTMRVYSPAAGVTVRMKVEDAADPTRNVETDATTTKAGAWETLTFNFANAAGSPLNTGYSYNKLVVFFAFGKSGSAGGAGTYYFDDVKFGQ